MEITDITDDMAPFVGVWKLERFTERSASLGDTSPLGQNPQGFLIYTADGFVSAQLMRSDREVLTTDPWDSETSTEGADLTRGYIAYCGSYVVHRERKEVIHRPVVALLPNLLNQEQHRNFKFEDDRLTLLTTRTRPSGGLIESSLVWRRSLQQTHQEGVHHEKRETSA